MTIRGLPAGDAQPLQSGQWSLEASVRAESPPFVPASQSISIGAGRHNLPDILPYLLTAPQIHRRDAENAGETGEVRLESRLQPAFSAW